MHNTREGMTIRWGIPHLTNLKDTIGWRAEQKSNKELSENLENWVSLHDTRFTDDFTRL